jgi:hypothetical protein
MFLISHRGNIDKVTDLENQPGYIDTAIALGYDVEIDVWELDGELWLGHDEAQYKIDLAFLLTRKDKLWCHAKNLYALKRMIDSGVHCFWQQGDDYAMTSKGYIFTHSKITKSTDLSILVSLSGDLDLPRCAGICSDSISRYKDE